MSKEILPDNLLKESLRKAQELKSSAYEKKIKQEEEHVFSEQYRTKMKKLVDDSSFEQVSNIKPYAVKKKSLKLKILLIAAIVMLMGSMTVLAVKPLREMVYQLIEKVFSDNTEVNFRELKNEIASEEKEFTEEDYEFRKIKNVPDNYKLEVEKYNPAICGFFQIFVNDEGQTIIYEQKVIGKLIHGLLVRMGHMLRI